MRRDLGPYPLWLRCWHWGNALLFVTLLISGFRIHFSNLGPPPLGFRTDVLIHNTAGILLTLFYCLFLYGNLRFGNARYYLIVADDIIPGLVRQPATICGAFSWVRLILTRTTRTTRNASSILCRKCSIWR